MTEHDFAEPVAHSPSIAALGKALAAAEIEFAAVAKNHVNPYFKSRYADLADLIEATRPALAKNGLTVIQLPRLAQGMAGVTTMLLHSSGEWLRQELLLPAGKLDKLDAQTVGSAVTYARRYAYQSLLNIAAEDDDDGNQASGNHAEPARAKKAAAPNRGHGQEGLDGNRVRVVDADQGISEVTGVIEAVERKTAKNGSAFAALRVGGLKMYTFSADMVEGLADAAGQTATVRFSERQKDGESYRSVVEYEILLADGQ